MSDSLTETTISIWLRFATTMKPVVLELEPVEAELVEAAAPKADVAEEPEEPVPEEPVPEEPALPAVTALPTALEIEAIVPVAVE
jgi:hypothetical protein